MYQHIRHTWGTKQALCSHQEMQPLSALILAPAPQALQLQRQSRREQLPVQGACRAGRKAGKGLMGVARVAPIQEEMPPGELN